MFGWFKRKPVPKGEFLHGHDLSLWTYLGIVTLKYDSTEHPVFLFVSNTNLKKRSYIVKGPWADQVKKYHNYVLKYLDPWMHGENEIYSFMDQPSNALKQWMLDYHGHVWDHEIKWWVTNEQARYHAAQKKEERNRKENPPEVIANNDPVVIQVNFGKKNED